MVILGGIVVGIFFLGGGGGEGGGVVARFGMILAMVFGFRVL